jgi:hypothetical protein
LRGEEGSDLRMMKFEGRTMTDCAKVKREYSP